MSQEDTVKAGQLIKESLKNAGFVEVGFLNRKDARFGDWVKDWLANGHHAEMNWMSKNRMIRDDPCSIEAFGKSIIIAAYPYKTPAPETWKGKHFISNYAWGEDYHKILKKKLKAVLNEIEVNIPGFKGKEYVDSAPIPEKIVAAKCGLGWIGKNSLLINRRAGSYLFLGEIICNLDLSSTPETKNYCGTCNKCVEACPTNAISENSDVDSRRCVSYLTIEKRGEFDKQEEKQIDYHIFGCDVCQQVCPWNEKVKPLDQSPFCSFERWKTLDFESLKEISENRFFKLKERSPVKRTKLEGIRRNAKAALKNMKNNWKDFVIDSD